MVAILPLSNDKKAQLCVESRVHILWLVLANAWFVAPVVFSSFVNNQGLERTSHVSSLPIFFLQRTALPDLAQDKLTGIVKCPRRFGQHIAIRRNGRSDNPTGTIDAGAFSNCGLTDGQVGGFCVKKSQHSIVKAKHISAGRECLPLRPGADYRSQSITNYLRFHGKRTCFYECGLYSINSVAIGNSVEGKEERSCHSDFTGVWLFPPISSKRSTICRNKNVRVCPNDSDGSTVRIVLAQRERPAKDDYGAQPHWVRHHHADSAWFFSDGNGQSACDANSEDTDVSMDGKHWFQLLGSYCFDMLPLSKGTGKH
jgi:hypothetical protein